MLGVTAMRPNRWLIVALASLGLTTACHASNGLSFTLNGAVFSRCETAGGPVGAGDDAVIHSPDGSVVAAGKLGAEKHAGSVKYCTFPFTVRDVPDGFNRYTFNVADTPAQTFAIKGPENLLIYIGAVVVAAGGGSTSS